MRWVKIGSRKVGVECAYLVGSAIFMYLMHTYSVRPQGAEFYMFYGVFWYNVVTYVALVLSDPGRIEDIEYRKKLDEIVSLITEISPNIVLRP